MHFLWVLFTALASRALAAPTPYYVLPKSDGDADAPARRRLARFVTADVDPLLKPAHFANAAYCSSASVTALSCGKACDALGDVEILLTGGDDIKIPKFYVAHDKQEGQVVVVHQGTNTGNLLSLINDLALVRTSANPARFPGVPEDADVHLGFSRAFERTADLILDTVMTAMSERELGRVLVIGHSLGAAIALLDALHIRLALPGGVQFRTVLFGMPRVGNAEFADFVDATMNGNLVRVTNDQDPVTQVPSKVFGYRHPTGEVHIRPGNVTLACAGQEDQDCAAGNLLLQAHFSDHLGPYFKAAIPMGGGSCPGFEDEPKGLFTGFL